MQSTTGKSSYLGKSAESRVGMIHDSIDSLQQSYSPKEKYSKKQGSCSASNCAAKQYFRGSNSISPLRNESDLNLSDPTSLSKIDSAPYEDTTPPLALPHPEEPSDKKNSTKREKLSRNCRKRPRSDDYPFLYGWGIQKESNFKIDVLTILNLYSTMSKIMLPLIRSWERCNHLNEKWLFRTIILDLCGDFM